MPDTRRVTIRDVAERAGVSVATVSKVINQRYGVSASTFSHVQAVIDELGYASSIGASSLRSLRTNVLGILITDLDPFGAELLKGIAQAVRDTGYELLVYSAAGRPSDRVGWERRYIARLGGTLIDGAVLVTPTVARPGGGIPTIAVDPHSAEPPAEGNDGLDAGPGSPTIAADNLQGGLDATRHLVDLGHRRIGLVAGRAGLESARLRRLGYERALAEAGIPLAESLIVPGSFERGPAQVEARRLLETQDRPTAVFATNDDSALGVLAAAAELGLDVPGQLSVIGFDNVPESVLADPPLSTVEQPIQLMGRRAIELLLARLGGEEVPLATVLPTRLVVRRSTGPVRDG
jgi:LacI family transcriptional regulator